MEDPSHPASAWSVQEVLSWANQERVADEVTDTLLRNQVDGSTLITLTQEELKSELSIQSLPARRHLWEILQCLQTEAVSSDYSRALQAHGQEIQRLAAEAEAAMQDEDATSEVVATLERNMTQQQRLMEDHMIAHHVQRSLANEGALVYENHDLACQEQERLLQLAKQEKRDRDFVLANFNGGQQGQQQHQTGVVRTGPRKKRGRRGGGGKQQQGHQQDHQQHHISPGQLKAPPGSASVSSAASTVKFSNLKTAPGSVAPMDMDQKPAASIHRLPVLDQCNVCFEERVQGFHLACDHKQCTSCMTKMLRTALQDSSLLPLRCCEIPIDMNVAVVLLNPQELQELQVRVTEKESKNHMYCPTCNACVNLEWMGALDSCTLQCDCGAALCARCKTLDHIGLTCEENKAARSGSDDLVLRISKQKGWKRCPMCRTMIELRSGCNHITCSSCRHEFCFKCLKHWSDKSGKCSSGECPVWDDDKLVEEQRRQGQL
eukprot:Nitzschia sp. Nitz4//scaffold247_size31676//23943//25415//NITZ4_007932-RA/size31676-processed-gene-0.21-mRNA-1//-1//CDS//3329543961//7547//frame0